MDQHNHGHVRETINLMTVSRSFEQDTLLTQRWEEVSISSGLILAAEPSTCDYHRVQSFNPNPKQSKSEHTRGITAHSRRLKTFFGEKDAAAAST
jgi:hypothetical protein